MAALDRFLERAEELHRRPLPMPFDMERMEIVPDESGAQAADPFELAPVELWLSSEARQLWIEYLNHTEQNLAPQGEFATVRDVAAKSAENACRLAAIFHVWQHGPDGVIEAEDMRCGILVASWFLSEARRVLGTAGVASEEADAPGDASLLARWIAALNAPPTLKEVAQLASYRLRQKTRREPAVAYLKEKHWVREERRKGSTVLVLNPKLQRRVEP